MNHVTATTDGFDCLVRIGQPKTMGCDQIQIVTLQVQLLQRQLARLVIMAPRRFDGDIFIRHFRERKVRKIARFSLDQQSAAFAL